MEQSFRYSPCIIETCLNFVKIIKILTAKSLTKLNVRLTKKNNKSHKKPFFFLLY